MAPAQDVDELVLEVTQQLRRQIGQDLHDGLGQLLTGTAFLAKALQHSLPAEHQPQVERIVELINQAIARVRALSRGLSPIGAGSHGLEGGLRDTVLEASELLGVRCELALEHSCAGLPTDSITQLCLIAREAITNAVRHGRAQHIVVRLAQRGAQSVLTVEDDGTGITPSDVPPEGLGLRSMRQRAQMLGGQLDILSTRSGTTVRCSFRAGE
jgi:two-component system sensor kinase FixL